MHEEVKLRGIICGFRIFTEDKDLDYCEDCISYVPTKDYYGACLCPENEGSAYYKGKEIRAYLRVYCKDNCKYFEGKLRKETKDEWKKSF